jgi:CDP-glucose 4,6-dehydratase
LEAVRQLKRPCVVVNVTSDKCYENQEWLWGYRENERMGGRDPYSNSKSCAELVAMAYRESFFPEGSFSSHGIALACARAGNAIGGGDWTANQLIPDLMRAFAASRPCLIRNPFAIRPWQFVLEPLRGYQLLAERLSVSPSGFAGGWNFGPAEGDAQTVSSIADQLAYEWGAGASWVQDSATHLHEAHLLKLDTSKAKARLEWHPVLPLKEALSWIVEWYRAFDADANLQVLTRTQIERYEALTREDYEATAKPHGPSERAALSESII